MKYFRRLQYVLDFNIASVVVYMFSLFDMRLFYNIMGIKNGFFLNWIVSTLKNPAIYLLFYYIKSLLCYYCKSKVFSQKCS